MSVLDHKPVIDNLFKYLTVRESLTLMRVCRNCYKVALSNTQLVVWVQEMLAVRNGYYGQVILNCKNFTEELCMWIILHQANVIWDLGGILETKLMARLFKDVIKRGLFEQVLKYSNFDTMPYFGRAYRVDSELKELTLKYLHSHGKMFRYFRHIDMPLSAEDQVKICRNYGHAIQHIHEDYYMETIKWAAIKQNPKVILWNPDDHMICYCVMKNWTVLKRYWPGHPAFTEEFIALLCRTNKKAKNYILSVWRLKI